jgi:hypothetical protein
MTEPLRAAAGGTTRPAMSRRAVVTVALLTAGGLAAATSSAWLRVSTWTPLAETAFVVPGAQAAPAVGAAAFVVATGAVALALARGRGRLVAATGIGLGGLLAAAAAATVLVNPDAGAVAAARSAVGVGVTTGPPAVMVAPWVALAMGVVGVAAGGCALVVSRRWSRPTARHVPEAAGDAAAMDGDPADQWDALSRGEDPTQ